MTSHYDSARLDELIRQLLDDQLDDAGIAALNSILRDSADARGHYRESVRLHAALIRHRSAGNIVPMPRARPSRRLAWTAVAACALLGGLVFFRAEKAPVAVLSGTTAAVWSGETPGGLHGPLELSRGFAEISFRNGVRVILEGPCQFQVTSATSMDVTHGRATVKVPRHIDGFHLDTPSGRITDLGTEFGVAVGSGSEGPVTLTEVFDGEIEIPAEAAARKRLHSGDSLAIVRESGATRLLSTLGDYRVDLGDSARKLPGASERASEIGNLALGKPVTSPAYYSRNHGSVFPPETLTDGRLNDSGSPGDWSFWLAPNMDSGEFTVDLLEPAEIGRIELQNTRNRTHGDRGLRHITVLVSQDGEDFREIFQAELAPIPVLPPPGVDFPFESFVFPAVEARFVRVIGLSHYRHPERPPENPNEGGGLNEIRIFAP